MSSLVNVVRQSSNSAVMPAISEEGTGHPRRASDGFVEPGGGITKHGSATLVFGGQAAPKGDSPIFAAVQHFR